MNQPNSEERNVVVLLAVLTTQFVLVINDVMINIALPSVARGLRFDPGEVSWIVNSYLVAFTGALLFGARLSDRFERRRLFQIGIGMFGLGAVIAAVAQTQALFLGGRVLQGLGGAVAAPAALATLTTVFADGRERNRALAGWSAVGGASGAAGLLVAGALTQVSWRLDLLLNVPLVLLLIAATPRFLPLTRSDSRSRSFDLAGAVTVTAGLALLAYALSGAAKAGWTAAATLERGLAGLLLLGLFVSIETRAREPILPLRLFRKRSVRGGNIVNLFVSMSLYTVPTFSSLYLQKILHVSPLQTGLESLPQAAAVILGAVVAAKLTTRVGFKATTLLSFLIGALGLIWFSGISADGSFAADVLGPSLVVGLAIGGSLASISVAALAGIPEGEHGIAAGLVNATHDLGKVLGLAILASIAARAAAGRGSAGAHLAALDAGYRDAFLGAAAFGLAGALLTIVLISTRESRSHSAAARQPGPVPTA
jgi:MFS family permease